MTKHTLLIPGEKSNWEVAAFLLIDYLYVKNSQISHIKFLRADHASIKALTFIENLLDPVGHVVDKTLNNSISSAFTNLEQKGYLVCEDGECILTNDGFNRLQEIKSKYDKNNSEPIGAYGKALQALKSLDPEIQKNILEKFNNTPSK
jgi:hypothetical protein